MYKILNAIITLTKEGYVKEIVVKTDCTLSPEYKDIRKYKSNTKPCSGYYYIPEKTFISNDLLQKVAGAGMRISK